MYIIKVKTTLGTIRFIDCYGFLTPDKNEAAKFNSDIEANKFAIDLKWSNFDVDKF